MKELINYNKSTIAAISTPPGVGGIGILRISGDRAREIASSVFKPANPKKDLTVMEGYTAVYGHVFSLEGELIDEAIALVFATPKSYTGEDVVELSCHGGTAVMQKVLRSVLEAGASLAEPGEFTKRAFLNNKLNLIEAEAVMDIISAGSFSAAKSATMIREGSLSRRIEEIKEDLMEVSSHIAAYIDFPDEDLPDYPYDQLGQDIANIIKKTDSLINTYDIGMVIKNGVTTAIVGAPNVGKSSLMNLLAGYNRSIVTDLPGTTRDVITEQIDIGGLTLNISDTAGIRETADKVENIGVELSKKLIDNAQLVIAVFDNSVRLSDEDRKIIELIRDKKTIAVINKIDLPAKTDKEYIKANIDNLVLFSALKKEGLEDLIEQIRNTVITEEIDWESPLISNERQRDCCIRARDYLNEAKQAVEIGITLDAIDSSLFLALDSLNELTGDKVTDLIIDQVFSRFCLGK